MPFWRRRDYEDQPGQTSKPGTREQQLDEAANILTRAALRNRGTKAEGMHRNARVAAEASLTIAQARRHTRGEG